MYVSRVPMLTSFILLLPSLVQDFFPDHSQVQLGGCKDSRTQWGTDGPRTRKYGPAINPLVSYKYIYIEMFLIKNKE